MGRGRRRKLFKLKLKPTTLYTFSSVGLFSVAALIILSFSQKGIVLTKLFFLLHYYFGWGMLILPFFFITAGLNLTRLTWPIARPNVLLGTIILEIAFVSLARTGLIGMEIWQSLAVLITKAGALIFLLSLAFIGFVITFNTSIEEMALLLMKTLKRLSLLRKRLKTVNEANKPRFEIASVTGLGAQKPEIKKPDLPKTDMESSINATFNSLSTKGQIWKYPPIQLLEESISGKADRGDIKKNAEQIEKTLESFGIAAQVAEVNLGPSVTQYALEIALGTKLSKITTLSNDLALALAAPTGQIRIEAPIPGRSLVGVEVPNRSPEVVGLRQMLASEVVKKSKSKLAVALGLNVSGEPIMADIARMPHALIAGSTGSGKSVCLHSFISTLLFRASPDEVKLILVDPKRVELTQYNGIPHLLTPVIVDPTKVLSALKWAIDQMDQRYKIFSEIGARNIDAYNELSGLTAMPYIVIIIDELADIMLFSPAEVEDSICRIAQMARATGIHLIISTQRPSVDVITGLIKANIPCRIAFNVSSQIDSRVIIDSPGAEKLLGRGDMLFVPPDQAKPTRIQGVYVSEPEIKKLIDFLKKSGVTPEYSEEVVNLPVKSTVAGESEGEKDGLFDEALKIICQYNRASASLLQRRLKVGYARAARILDQLEQAGLIGPADGSKQREVLVKNPPLEVNE